MERRRPTLAAPTLHEATGEVDQGVEATLNASSELVPVEGATGSSLPFSGDKGVQPSIVPLQSSVETPLRSGLMFLLPDTETPNV